MTRGDIVAVAIAGDKPRPAVVIQNDVLQGVGSSLVCLLTSDVEKQARQRLLLDPNIRNGLRSPSLIMTEKIHAVSHSKIGATIGSLSALEMRRLDRQLTFVLGLGD